MTLSKQYFTVLQLLRTARQQIDLNLAAWDEFCGTSQEGQLLFEKEWFVLNKTGGNEESLKSWETQQNKVTQHLRIQTESLRGRIDRKTEEVKSLRDGVRLAEYQIFSRFCVFKLLGFQCTNRMFSVIQCNIASRSNERHGSEPCNIRVYGCYYCIHTAWVHGCKSASYC